MPFDPFAYYESSQIDEIAAVDEEMFTVAVGKKVFGIDEGMLIGIVIGYLFAQLLGEL